MTMLNIPDMLFI